MKAGTAVVVTSGLVFAALYHLGRTWGSDLVMARSMLRGIRKRAQARPVTGHRITPAAGRP